MEVPDYIQRDQKHDNVREDIDNRSGNENKKGVHALRTRHIALSGALEKHNEDEGDAVADVEPDCGPNDVEDFTLSGARRTEEAEEEE